MLNYVPTENEIINEYRKLPASSTRPLTDEMRKVIEKASKPKKGGKIKPKAGPSKPAQTLKMKIKRAARKPRSPNSDAEEDSESRTIYEVHRI